MNLKLERYSAKPFILSMLVIGLICGSNVGAQERKLTIGSVGFEARGLVRSATRVDLQTELIAPVSQTPFKSGQAFEQGDLLISFDCSKYEAETNAAKASADAAFIEAQTKKRLLRLGAAGRDEVLLASAFAEKAMAELKMHRARNKACKFTAPFSGRVVELYADVHEYPPNDKPLLTIINDNKLELEMVVPSNWLTWLVAGTKFEFQVDETGEQLNAAVDKLAAEVDPVSQTIKVVARLETAGSNVLAGMSGTANFPRVGG